MTQSTTYQRYSSTYVHLFGPGDARPTAMQLLEDEGKSEEWKERVVLITGCAATSGIGLETAKTFYRAGAHVYVTSRTEEKAREVVETIQRGEGDGKVSPLTMELDSLSSVRQCAKDFLKQEKQLHVLILNAGVMATPKGTTRDGFETQIGTNHVGHHLLFRLLTEALLSASTPSFLSRVVCVASTGHRLSPASPSDLEWTLSDPYHSWLSYGKSKTANIYLATEIHRRHHDRLLAVAIHPGLITTPLARHLDEEAMKGFPLSDFLNAQQGAAMSFWAGYSQEVEKMGGKYLEEFEESESLPEGSSLPVYKKGRAAWAYDEKAAKDLWEATERAIENVAR
ncbi:WW domain-containing oxidoreductase [Planoprotostelium fungivorum]|uniref:WW domain-containing oxidoreductase n=1 Tax=Planoprotostelium fungivorum TaxID=1890364 RepID=A0A2P6NLS6_9EUKA|nr:WW domain-containing oxidoreductase [Planoprotostelium fungivorum]